MGLTRRHLCNDGEIERLLNTKTVVGEPITPGDTTILPLVSIGFGFGAGGGSGSATSGETGEGTGMGTGGGGVVSRATGMDIQCSAGSGCAGYR